MRPRTSHSAFSLISYSAMAPVLKSLSKEFPRHFTSSKSYALAVISIRSFTRASVSHARSVATGCAWIGFCLSTKHPSRLILGTSQIISSSSEHFFVFRLERVEQCCKTSSVPRELFHAFIFIFQNKKQRCRKRARLSRTIPNREPQREYCEGHDPWLRSAAPRTEGYSPV